VVYGAALEMRFGGNPIEGSNPSLSATLYRIWTLRYDRRRTPPASSFCGYASALLGSGKGEWSN